MNKIYKVIWSKAKNCYVVVSELAKSHTKSPKSRVISKITIAGILACTFVYGTTFPLSVDAAKYEAGGGNATGTNAIAVGTNSDASGDYGLSVGINADSKTLNSIAIGHGATADTATDSSGQIAIGYGATTNSGMAIGSGAKTGDKIDNVSGAHSIAFGLNSYAGGTNAVVIGAYTEGGKNSVVIGAEAVSYANTDSVAIGRSAVTHSNNTVVIGDNAIAYELGSVVIGPSAETENASAMSYGKHSVVLGMDGFVNADDSMALGANATAYERNSVALGTGSVANVANVISIGHVSGDESLLSTYTSDLYRRIINMANGTSAHDGATVGQIQTTTAGNGVAITNSNNSNGSVNHAIAVKASTGITVNGNGVSITPGSVTSGNVNAITGGTAYTELRPANGTFVKQNQTTAQNLTALDNAGKNAIKGLSVNGRVITYTKGDNTTGTITTQDTTYSAGNGLSLSGTTFSVKPGTNVTVNNDGVNVIGSGTVTNGNTGLVSGGTMYSELRSGATGNYISPDNTVGSNLNALDSQVKTNATDISNLKNLSNITEDGKTVVRNLAKESVKVIPGSYTNIVEGTDGNAKTYAVNVIVNGQIVENNEGIVTGNTVYQALEQQKTALETDLSGKANIELDNISDEGHNVIKTDAKASINVVGGEYATVTKSNQSGVDTYMVNVATNGEIEENNGNLVTGDTVYRALQDQQTAIDSGLAGKANVDASNITDTIAWGEKVGIGTVTEDNGQLVTGGTVYEALQSQKDMVDTALDGKANISLNNVNEAGHTVIKTDAKSAIALVGNEDITVTKTDVNRVDNYNIALVKDGAVASGEEKVVTGGAVYDALQAEVRPAQDGKYVTKDATTGANLTALDTALKDGLDAKANISLDNINNAGRTVIQNATNVVSGDSIIDVSSVTANGVRTYTITANINPDGDVEENNAGLVSGGTIFSEVRPEDGNYVAKDNTTAENLTVLDTVVKDNADAIGQVNTDMNSKANVGLDNINDTGHDVIKADAKASINVVGGDYATVEKTNVNGVDTYTVNIATDGTIANGDTDIVSGGTVYNETRPASDGNYIETDNSAGENLTALDIAVKNNVNAINTINTGLDTKANVSLDNITTDGETVIKNLAKSSVNVIGNEKATVTKSNVNGVDTYAVSVVADGIVANGDTNIVSGNTVYNALQDIQNDINTALDGKANIELDNIADNGKTVIRTLAKEAVVVSNGANTTVTSTTDANGNISYAIKTNALGQVAEGNTELVDGNTVYEAIKAQGSAVIDELDSKANKDASNVADYSAQWGSALGKGVVEANNGELVTGGNVYDALVAETRPVQDGNYITSTNSAGDNLNVLDTQVKTNADDITDLKNLSNITDAGKTVIKNLSKGSVNVVGVDKATVTKSDVDGVDTYTVSVKADGVVQSDNKGLVDGGTVNDAIITAVGNVIDYTNDGFAGKANVELDNITDEGHDVIKTDAKSAVNITGDTDALVTKTDVNGVDTYAISINKNGAVAQDNEEIVTGGAVYTALQTQKDTIDTVLDTKANVGLDNITDDGKTVIRNLAKDSVKVISGGEYTTVTEGIDGDAKTYAVNVLVNGTVADGNTGLVTGDTVFEETRVENDGNYVSKDNTAGQSIAELDRVLKETRDIAEAAASTGVDTNAVHYDNVDKEIVTLAGENGTALTNLKDGTLSADSKDAVTGKQLFETNEKVAENAERITTLDNKLGTISDGNYVTADKTFGENIDALDTQLKTVSDGLDTVRTDVDDLRDTLTETVNGKADTDLGNLTDDGKTVIADIAKESVKVKGSGLATVTSAEEGQTTVYTVDVQADGVIEEDNTGLVNGGTVYNSIQEVRNDFTTDLGGKADVDLNNLTDAGKEMIRETMQGDLDKKADKVDLETKANVDASNIDTKAWQEALGDGVIEEGNTGLINGGTAFRAIQEIKDNEVVKADFENGVIRFANDAKYDGIDVINVSKSDGSSRVMTGVATNPNDPTSVANVGYVNAIGQNIIKGVNNEFSKVNDRMDKVGAGAAAMAGLVPGSFDDGEKWNFSAAVGNYRSASAGAVGMFYKPNENVTLAVKGAFGNGENMVSGGVGIALSKGNLPGITKAQLARTVNVQADKIQQQDIKIQEQDARIAELESVVAELVAKR